MSIKLSPETKKKLIKSIKRYWLEEIGEDIGDLKASLVLDFYMQEICPTIYNQAIKDARAFIEDKLSDLEDTCYEPEFNYWDD